MPTKDGSGRPKAGMGLGSAMTREAIRTKAKPPRSAKPLRNRNRVVPPAVGRRKT
jgi:hypothetical protein